MNFWFWAGHAIQVRALDGAEKGTRGVPWRRGTSRSKAVPTRNMLSGEKISRVSAGHWKCLIEFATFLEIGPGGMNYSLHTTPCLCSWLAIAAALLQPSRRTPPLADPVQAFPDARIACAGFVTGLPNTNKDRSVWSDSNKSGPFKIAWAS